MVLYRDSLVVCAKIFLITKTSQLRLLRLHVQTGIQFNKGNFSGRSDLLAPHHCSLAKNAFSCFGWELGTHL